MPSVSEKDKYSPPAWRAAKGIDTTMNENEKELHTEGMTENRENVSEQNQPELQEFTEEEKLDILSVFAETNENKRRRSGFRLTIKNQLILVASILVIAGALLGTYFLFLKEEEPLPAFYVLTDTTVSHLDALEEDVTFTFCNRREEELNEESDPDVYRIYTYATLYVSQTGNVEIDFDSSDTFNGVKIRVGDKTAQYLYKDFYVARDIDGKVYGFDGERIFTNTILELLGKDKAELSVRPLDGFDKDGNDVLTSGRVVMFPKVERSDISYLEVENETGKYLVYQDNGTFYFDGCEFLTYNAETFASLLVDCRYVVTAGKLQDRMDLAVYGFGKEPELTCKYTLMTNPDQQGNFYVHQVQIGKKAASGSYYYAMYFGVQMNSKNEVVKSFPSDQIFLLPYSSVEGNLTQPVETFFDAQLVNGIQDINDVYEIEQVYMDFYYYDEEKPDMHALVLNLPVLDFSSNTASNNTSGGELLKDKKTYASSGLKYADWTGEKDGAYLVGLASSDAKTFYVNAAITNIASDGAYDCTFGLLLDSDNSNVPALLPDDVTIRYSCDGINYEKLTNHGLDFSAHPEDTVKEYTFRIQSDEPVVKVEIGFTMPQKKGYLVMDEIRIYADGEDAVPNDALTGLWRLLSPDSYVPEGKNYAYLDSTNFSEFLNGIATLMGDSVAKVGISEQSKGKGNDTIHTEMLVEFGLDKPAFHIAYLFDGFMTDLYISAYDEENQCYYVYSTITGDVYGEGTEVTFCTGLVARLSKETAPWLEWNLMEYMDRSMVGMYIYEIEDMTIAMGDQEYTFRVNTTGQDINSVMWGDKSMDVESFRYVYLSVVQLNAMGEYTPAEGDNPEEYMRIRIKTTTDEKEFVFYRVSSSRAYYTINGTGSYYCRVSDLRNVASKLEQFIAGEKVGRQ